jgi:hypothetical protein
MKRNRTPNNIHKVQRPNISDYSNQCSFFIEKEPVPTTIKVQFLLLLLVLLIQQYPLDSCTVKICSVGNFRNQLPFISKHIFIFRQTHSDFCFRRGSNFASGSQKIDHQCIDLVGNLDLHPMACVGNPFEMELGNPRF